MVNRRKRRIIKYLVNILGVANLILLGLAPIWGWYVEPIVSTITVIANGIGALFLLEQGAWKAYKNRKEKAHE